MSPQSIEVPPQDDHSVIDASIASRLVIISGGQTGADRAALDFAINHGFAHAGWCPKGRLAEDGRIPDSYHLRETPSRRYAQRTEWNVRDSDATIIFSITPQVRGGTALTRALAHKMGKPLLHVASEELSSDFVEGADIVRQFVAKNDLLRLNIAGPRHSGEPSIGDFVTGLLQSALTRSQR